MSGGADWFEFVHPLIRAVNSRVASEGASKAPISYADLTADHAACAQECARELDAARHALSDAQLNGAGPALVTRLRAQVDLLTTAYDNARYHEKCAREHASTLGQRLGPRPELVGQAKPLAPSPRGLKQAKRDEQVLAVLPATAPEISTKLSLPKNSVYRALERLEKRGRVRATETARGRVWEAR